MPDPANIALKDIDFEWMHKAYYSALCRYAERIVKQKEEAECIVSDFFTTLWIDRENKHIIKSLKSYLYQGVHNNCLKCLQHKNVSRRYSEHIQKTHTMGNHEGNNPLSMIILNDLARKIDNAINALPAQCREIFVLVRIKGFKYHEVAEKMDISIGTVRTQISRAKNKLQEFIKNME
ncbi:MAG: RNA polymerase sigma-70 factor [Bacteroidales bacterium]|nr:RNA polymerase sigma-70 factor [Bacteroidales bacterium]